MSRKTEIFEKVLTNPYDNGIFVNFVQEFLNNVELVAPSSYKKVYNNFSYYVDGYYHIGNYTGNDGNKIAIFSVALRRGDSLERARTMQRNFVKPLLENSMCAGALVAFYTLEEPEKWRLSFIRLDYEFSKGKVTEKITPAKRYSYLVGQGEPCNTAKQRLFPIFNDDNNNPDIDELEEAFSVEKVTNEFFQQYCEKYHQLREYLESNDDFMEEARIRNFTSEQFAKKLLGQIVFLYFIQKKGWLGVGVWPKYLSEKEYNNVFFIKGAAGKIIKEYLPKIYVRTGEQYQFKGLSALEAIPDDAETTIADNMVNQQKWGNGDKEFVRTLYNWSVKRNMNFFDDCLEPLFYETLNENRGEMAYCSFLHCRIPFLNGGLFEQLDNYKWKINNFDIPNSIFSNKDEKGRDADGILDIFDRYNFTMNEDEPMEREVAIDPEMLGKVFENLLDVKDRKSKGAFYTPREIVHYMCQETLINYLVTKTGISEAAIRDFILYGEYLRDEDTMKTLKVTDANGKAHYEFDKSKDLLISEEILSFKKGVNRLKELDDLLANVKVADLAVGSGAFPLGMLNEIVKARQVLTEYMAIGMNSFEKKLFYVYGTKEKNTSGRKAYDLKVNTIKNCIFACDIEPSAVDIAKLRLWLAIVIDDEITENAGNGDFDTHSKPRQLPNLDCNIICGNSLMDEFMGNKLITESVLLNNVSENSQQSMFQYGVDAMLSKLIELQDKLFFTKDHNDKEEIKEEIQKIYDDIILEQIQDDEVVQAYNNAKNQSSKPFVLWQLYFPKVFRDNGGFDIIIGNPPYVLIQDMDIPEKMINYYKRMYKVASYKVDLYHLFIERAIQLTNMEGVISLITPSNFTTNNYCEPLRRFMLENMYLKDVVFYDENVFEANVNNLVYVGSKKLNEDGKIQLLKARRKEHDWEFYDRSFITQSFYMKDSYIIIPIDSMEAASIVDKMDGTNLIVKDIATVNFGMQLRDRKKYPADVTTDETLLTHYHRPCYTGKNIGEYMVEYEGLYCYFNREAKKGGCWEEEAQLANPKLLCRQIGKYPTVGIDEKGYPVLNTAFMISKFQNEMSPYVLLGILNSRLIKFYWKQKFSDNRKQFPKIKGTYLEQIPINRNDEVENDIFDAVKKILENNRNEEEIGNLKSDVDSYVYMLYGLDDNEIKTVNESRLD